MRELHLPEWVKNLLIVLLSLSAVYLFTLSPLYRNSPLEGWTARLLDREQSVTPVSVSLLAAAQPTRIAIRGTSGCYAVQYDTDAVDAAFAQVGSLLGEALVSAEAPMSISEDLWRQILTDSGIYFDFSGQVPLPALAGWLTNGAAADPLTANVRRVVLAAGSDTVWLCYQDAGDGLYYACATSLNTTDHLQSAVDNFTPNNALFAFEDPQYAQCHPYTLITATPQPGSYTAANSLPTSDSDVLNSVLSALSFSGLSVNSYSLGESTVYLSGEDTLSLTQDGVLTYSGADSARYPVASKDETPTLTEYIEATRQLAAATMEPLCGSARLYLISARQEAETTIITYGYSLEGAGLWLGNEGWAAQFVLSGNALTQFTLHFRSYTATGGTTLVLPPLQASAAMAAEGAQGGELLLIYLDPGSGSNVISAGWIAG